MRYFIIILLLITLMGCGSSSTEKEEDGSYIDKPSSPKLQDNSTQPPSIPNI
jgi:hypothetical protein